MGRLGGGGGGEKFPASSCDSGKDNMVLTLLVESEKMLVYQQFTGDLSLCPSR